jgi:hypothetical protein
MPCLRWSSYCRWRSPVIRFIPRHHHEMTILLGVLFTLIGFHVVSGLPAWQDHPYDERLPSIAWACRAWPATRAASERLHPRAGPRSPRSEDAS